VSDEGRPDPADSGGSAGPAEAGDAVGPASTETGVDDGTGRDWRGRALRVIQWTVALGAFWYVARDVDWGATATELASVPAPVVLAILGLTAVEFVTRFGMWASLLGGRFGVSFSTAARIDLVIKFINHVIPSKASGHSVAPLVVRHYTGVDWSEAVSVAGVNTGLYATLYGLTTLAGLGLFAPRLGSGLLVVIVLSTGMYVAAGGLVLLAGRRMELAGGLVGRLEVTLSGVPAVGSKLAGVAGALPSFTEDSADVFRELTASPSVVLPYALGWAGTLMVVPGLRVSLLLTGLGGSFSPAALLPVVLVTAYSVTVLPLTPGGVGVAEFSATAVLVALGVSTELAAVVVLVDRTLGVYLPAMLGWVPMARLDLPTLLSGGR